MTGRRSWTFQEDKILKQIYYTRQQKWANIASIMMNQFNFRPVSGKQCSQRFKNKIIQNKNSIDWTKEQIQILFKSQKQIGNKWVEISTFLEGRTESCVKNYFYSRVRKIIRRINKQIKNLKQLKKQFNHIQYTYICKVIEITDYPFRKDKVQKIQNYQICRGNYHKHVDILDTIIMYDDQINLIQNNEDKINFIKQLLQKISLVVPLIKKRKKIDKLYKSQSQSQSQELSLSSLNQQLQQIYINDQISGLFQHIMSTKSFQNLSNDFNKKCKQNTLYQNRSAQLDDLQDYFEYEIEQKVQFKSQNIKYKTNKHSHINITPMQSLIIDKIQNFQQIKHLNQNNIQMIQQKISMSIYFLIKDILQQNFDEIIPSPKKLTQQQSYEINNIESLFLNQQMNINMDIQQQSNKEKINKQGNNPFCSIPKLDRIKKDNFQV